MDLRNTGNDVAVVARGGTGSSNVVRIDVDAPAEPVITRVDADRMRQVIWNLVKNAIQASPHEGTVTVRTGLDGRGRAYLEVADEGPGIGLAQRERLFDMFYSGRSHGVGLGLAFVKQIVDQHEGQVEIVDGGESGACFRVTLPPEGDALKPSEAALQGARRGPPHA